MKQSYYEDKSVHYGIGHTRLRRILGLGGDVAGKRVLDVACASGYLGREFKKRGASVVGVEVSEAAAQAARAVLDSVEVFDIERPWPVHALGEKFDLILLPEILEHVFDPVAVLAQASSVLAEEGEIIITTPNFMTWTNRLRFLFGDFQYQEQGMFDFGHIRWFTYAYLKEVLAKTGFRIVGERNIIFPGKLTRVLRLFPSLFAFQFVVKAKRT